MYTHDQKIELGRRREREQLSLIDALLTRKIPGSLISRAVQKRRRLGPMSRQVLGVLEKGPQTVEEIRQALRLSSYSQAQSICVTLRKRGLVKQGAKRTKVFSGATHSVITWELIR